MHFSTTFNRVCRHFYKKKHVTEKRIYFTCLYVYIIYISKIDLYNDERALGEDEILV